MKLSRLVALSLIGAPLAAQAQEASVMHWWTSQSEAAALSVIASAYTSAGGIWVDQAVPDFDTALASATSAILNGTAPTAMQFNAGGQMGELAANGLLTPLDDYAAKDGWADKLSPALKALVSHDGKIYALPVDVQSQLWMFSNRAALAKAGVTAPQSWAEFMANLPKLKAAGIVPLAQGGEGWQDVITFEAVLLHSGKADLYKALFVDGDVEALKSERFLEAARDLKTLSTYLDAGATGRKWNDAAAMVISGQAGYNFTGDWALPAFAEAGLVAGKDFDCQLGLGGQGAYVAVTDVFVMPADPKQAAAQALFAKTVMDPKTQADFNLAKGSLPPRLDVSIAPDTLCGQRAVAFLAGGGEQLVTPASTLSPDRYGAVSDVISQALHTQDLDAEALVAGLISALQSTEN